MTLGSVKDVRSRSGVTQIGAELLRNGRELTTKVGNNLGLSSCAVPRSTVAREFVDSVRDVQSGSGVTQNGAELLRNERGLTTKVGEQPWPQLVHCASIDCRACGCVFQED